MEIYRIPGGILNANTYVVHAKDSDSVIVIDPTDCELLHSFMDGKGLHPIAILLTHGHFDHIISLDTLRDALGVPAMIHKDDAEMLADGKKNAFFTFFGKDRRYRDAEKLLSDGDVIPLGDTTVKVIHTPGHSRGSVCYLADGALISGDTLFAEGYGRYDLHGGDLSALRTSLSSLRALDPALKLYSGHGAPSTLGAALDNSAYLF